MESVLNAMRNIYFTFSFKKQLLAQKRLSLYETILAFHDINIIIFILNYELRL